ncbi:MAG: GTP 3',8-cyclase MoaA [Candidatus Cloacimonadota bacterium]|nr:MAG: GTP 3',8-cyclase MoaA [Candidatus Cloacimonadota bacterium]
MTNKNTNSKESNTIQEILDLRGRPIKDLRISVIDACNFRCTYCMPNTKSYSFMTPDERLTADEIIRLAKIFTQLGVDKVRLTGGEPLLRKDLFQIISGLSSIKEIKDIALTTNAFYLKQQAKMLKDSGLTRITVSLDSLDPKTNTLMSGVTSELNRVIDGIRYAQELGFNPIKMNTVVKKGMNDQDIKDLVQFSLNNNIILRMIEYMDVGNQNDWKLESVIPSKVLVEQISKYAPLEVIEPNYHGEVATRYRFKESKGEIGFISSVTQAFCGSCNRGRISASGKFYKCLFSTEELDLRALLRANHSDQEITKKIVETWTQRNDNYSETRTEQTKKRKKIEMYEMGG